MTATATRTRTPKTDEAATRQIIAALLAAGYVLDHVYYGDDDEVKVSTVDEAWDAIDAVDDAFVYFKHPDRPNASPWVEFILGNSPEEVAANYVDSLDPIIDPVMRSWW